MWSGDVILWSVEKDGHVTHGYDIQIPGYRYGRALVVNSEDNNAQWRGLTMGNLDPNLANSRCTTFDENP